MRRAGLLPVGVAAFSALAIAAFCPTAIAVPASQTVPAAAYGGFSTTASATPLRLEIYEPAIPIPADPQAELNFSYSKVAGSSGPMGSARASAMWPGAPVGEGLKTIVEQAGLPAQLGAAGYPVQINAQSPGDPESASQEVLPGQVDRVRSSNTESVARSGYSSSGDLDGDQPDTDTAGASPSSPLDALKSGDLGALGGLLSGTKQGTGGDPPAASPLGALSLLVDISGMSSVSRTDYSGDTVSAQSTAEVGKLSLVAGLVQLSGIRLHAAVSSNIDSTKTKQQVDYGRLSILGSQFALTSDGIETTGKTTAIPGLSDDPTKALAALGISVAMPKPKHAVAGSHGTVSTRGPVITVDSEPLRSKLPALPLDKVTSSLPDSAGQVKSLLLALGEAHPKIVLVLGQASAEAQVVKGIGMPSTTSSDTPVGLPGGSGQAASPSTSSGSGGATAGSPLDASAAAGPTAAGPISDTAITPTSATPGLPPLGSVPGLLTIGAIALGGFAGWWFRRGLGVLFGGAGICPHGLESGLPDLRKV